MDEDLRTEKLILKISFTGSFLLLIAEIVMAFVSRSQAIIMDCLFDVADIIMLGPFMMLVPLLYQPVTEKRPYGFSQVESLFLIVKYGILIVFTVKLVVDNVRLLMSGGHHINAGAVAIFEMTMAVLGLAMYLILRHMNKKLSSPTTKADLCMWRIDALSTFGVGVAFIVQIILQGTSFRWIAPYIDPLIALTMAVILIREPIVMFAESIKNLILFAPKKEIVDDIRQKAYEALKKYKYDIEFLDIIKTGRKIWIEVYITPEADLVSISNLKRAHDEIIGEISQLYDNVYLEIIPEIE